MAIYEYECSKCERLFEELSRTPGDTDNVRCPSCGSPSVVRRQSVFAARGAPTSTPLLPAGGACGRCGDPNGPCGS